MKSISEKFSPVLLQQNWATEMNPVSTKVTLDSIASPRIRDKCGFRGWSALTFKEVNND